MLSMILNSSKEKTLSHYLLCSSFGLLTFCLELLYSLCCHLFDALFPFAVGWLVSSCYIYLSEAHKISRVVSKIELQSSKTVNGTPSLSQNVTRSTLGQLGLSYLITRNTPSHLDLFWQRASLFLEPLISPRHHRPRKTWWA